MVAYLLQQLGLICTQDVAAEFGLYRIENYYNTPCSFPVALFDSLIGAFFRRPLLNTPLWTITYEMFGGVLVYAITLGCQRFRYRRIFYFVLSALSLLFLHNTYIAALLFGLLLSDLLYNNHIALKLDQKLCNILRSPPHKDRTYSCINSVSSSCSDGYPLFPILSTALCLDPDSVAILWGYCCTFPRRKTSDKAFRIHVCPVCASLANSMLLLMHGCSPSTVQQLPPSSHYCLYYPFLSWDTCKLYPSKICRNPIQEVDHLSSVSNQEILIIIIILWSVLISIHI